MSARSLLPLRRTLVVLSLLAACGGADRDEAAAADSTVDSAAAAPAEVAATPAAPTDAPDDAPLGAADLDRWQQGMAAELQAVQDAGAKLAAARTGMDSLAAVGATSESATRDVGAAAAGVSGDRYQKIRSTLGNLVGQMVPAEYETNGKMPAEMAAQMKQGREAGLANVVAELPPELVEAARPRAEALHKQEVELLAARMRAAGMTRR